MKNRPVIYWFRKDLRLHDNPALNYALKLGRPLILVYIFDDRWFQKHPILNFPRTGALRQKFLAETIADLEKAIIAAGNRLLIFNGNTTSILSDLFNFFNAEKIIAQKEIAYEETQIERNLLRNTKLEMVWGSMLYPPDQISFSPEKAPFYFTQFKNKIIQEQITPHPVPTVNRLDKAEVPKPPPHLPAFNPDLWIRNTPNSSFMGGETEGLKRLHQYFEENGHLHYANTRNLFEGKNFSSWLAPWLANGALSPRTLFSKLNITEKLSDQEQESILTLKNQLIWRDYFRYLFLRYGSKLFTTKGLRNAQTNMYNDLDAFLLWKDAKTGEPIIDALMRQLRKTGFMSNRGRMLVSFYLAKELKVNWQWGAAWFESALIDYDVYSNYGNWAYQSGRGTDSRVNRRFNLKTQTRKFDKQDLFTKKWNGNLF
ncbi:DASH family cryptochrome [Thermophagus sp. OGC60D27]|uniref:DASH family cryptochrome n=1 Tax=Thermophagus sp. OGC60D27 TaxID=3458415 RepID=UPI00403814E9